MESVGAYLRDLRLARGVSLEEVARATRVSRHYLEALEREEWVQLPAPPFTKGFIRAYCQVLGVRPDDAIAGYTAVLRSLPEPAALASASRPARRPSREPVLVSFGLLVALGLGLFLLSLRLQGPQRPEPAPPAAAIATVPSPAPAAAPPSVPAPRGQRPTQSRLVARAIEPTWIRVQLGGAKVLEELLPAGATREWVSDGRFVLTIGNAGGVNLELNGRSLPSLGASGAVIQRLVLPLDEEVTSP